MVASSFPQHVCYKLRSDRSPALVLLVLSSVHEMGNDGGDSTSRGNFACVNHDTELHEGGVDFPCSLSSDIAEAKCELRISLYLGTPQAYSVQDIYIIVSDTFYDLDLRFA
jgi:hypothetical protein